MSKTKLTPEEMEVALVVLGEKRMRLREGDQRVGVLSSICKKLGKRLKKGEGR